MTRAAIPTCRLGRLFRLNPNANYGQVKNRANRQPSKEQRTYDSPSSPFIPCQVHKSFLSADRSLLGEMMMKSALEIPR